MKNKKGFTLVELIAVMFILLLLVLIAFPNFAGLSGNAKNKYDNTICILLKNAARMYVGNHPEIDFSSSSKIKIEKLINEEYLDSDVGESQGIIISPNDEVTVVISQNNGVTEYDYRCPEQLQN